jgi:hypothetical protein
MGHLQTGFFAGLIMLATILEQPVFIEFISYIINIVTK